MSDNASFPKTAVQALALLYCEKHANDSTSAAELYDMYQAALKEIEDHHRDSRNSQL